MMDIEKRVFDGISTLFHRDSYGLPVDAIVSELLKLDPYIIPQPLYHPKNSYRIYQKIFHPNIKDWFTVIHAGDSFIQVEFTSGEIHFLIHNNKHYKISGIPNSPQEFIKKQVQEVLTQSDKFIQERGAWRIRKDEDEIEQPKNVYIKVSIREVFRQQGIIEIQGDGEPVVKIRLPESHPAWNDLSAGDRIQIELKKNDQGNTVYLLLLNTLEKQQVNVDGKQSELNESKIDENDNTARSKSTSTSFEGNNFTKAEQQKQTYSEQPGIDPHYFKQREKEGHRFEIMSFFKKHLTDGLIEWYEMVDQENARFAKPHQPLDSQVDNAIRNAEKNFQNFYEHQALALDSLRAGRNLIIVTKTASGKTLCYNPGIFEHISGQDDSARALYIFPLNALLMDQKEKIDALIKGFQQAGIEITAEFLIGGMGNKRFEIARANPHILVVNPELLSVMLGEPMKWREFFKRLQYVVIDEVHSYRSMFGMHMAGILRRLLLTAHREGAKPQFILSSATVSNPKELAVRLTSLAEDSFEFIGPEKDGSFQANKHWIIANPDYNPAGNDYDSYLNSAATIMVELLCSYGSDRRESPLNTILFAKSIREVNKVHRLVTNQLKDIRPELVKKIRKYVSAELSYSDKQEIYNGLKSGNLVGVVSTNALEAGIDIGKLDAAIITGFPFWVMRMRQMAGRVGRMDEGLVVFVPHPYNSVDQYYRQNPDLLLTQPPEIFVVDTDNPYIARKHINAAAYNLNGISEDELSIFGKNANYVVLQGIRDGVMRKSGQRVFGTRRFFVNTKDIYAVHNLRARAQIPYTICRETSQCSYGPACFESNQNNRCPYQIAILDQNYAYRDCHPGAIYEAPDGNFYRVRNFDNTKKVIQVNPLPESNVWDRTFVDKSTTVNIIGESWQSKELPNGTKLHLGEVQVTQSFTGYSSYTIVPKRRCNSCKIEYPLTVKSCQKCLKKTSIFYDQTKPKYHEFPEPYNISGLHITLNTVACWLTLPAAIENSLTQASPCKLPGSNNLVQKFIQSHQNFEPARKHLNLTDQELQVIRAYHAKSEVARNQTSEEITVLFPGVYGQCLLSQLREISSDSRALYLFEKLVGYPISNDSRHVCHKCISSTLFPAMHTLEHTIYMRYPAVALGDPGDLGSYSTLGHPGTGSPTIFWFDVFDGGIGAAEKVFEGFQALLEASEKTLSSCSCNRLEGCPQCTQIVHCDLKNAGLEKPAGLALISLLQGIQPKISYKPYIYPKRKAYDFEKIYKENEFYAEEQGMGEGESTESHQKASNPWIVLRVQQQVHTPVLNKAFEIRSTEITQELPPTSAAQLNQAYQSMLNTSKQDHWNINSSMSPHQILEILPTASLKMISHVYRVIALAVHPDTYPGDKAKANEMMKLVNQAYEQVRYASPDELEYEDVDY